MRQGRWVILAALGVLLSCSWWMAGRGPAVEPADTIIMSHKAHAGFAVECADCHGAVASSASADEMFRPTEAACLECHEQREPCSFCHTDVERRPAKAPRDKELDFSHAQHGPRAAEKGCTTCHLDVAESTALPIAAVSMDTCLTCHEHAEEFAAAQCSRCHDSLQRLSLRAVAQLDHAGDFMPRHGMLARQQGAECVQCHTESACAECHSRLAPAVSARLFPEEVERPLLHRADFATTHGSEARLDGASCLRCHGRDTQSSCENCHATMGLSPGGVNTRDPHPPGYAVPGNAEFHGRDARLHITTCVGCHDQGAASICVRCHQSGGVGGYPHPPGWAAIHPASEIASQTMCRACHF